MLLKHSKPHIFSEIFALLKLKKFCDCQKNERFSKVNACDIFLDVCAVIVQNLMHMIYFQVVHECTKLSCEQLSE